MKDRPASGGAPADPLPIWAALLFFGLAFFGLAQASDWLSVKPSGFVTLWLPAGLFVAVLLGYECRVWPWLVAVGFAANLAFELSQHRPPQLALGFALVNALEGLGGAALTRRLLGGCPRLDSLRHLLVFLGCAGILAPVVGAGAGTAFAGMHAGQAPDLRTALLWWSGNATGLLALGPLILAWKTPASSQPTGRWFWLEALALLLLLGLATWLVLTREPGMPVAHKYLLMPLMLWAGLRLGPRGASLASVALVLLVSVLVAHGDTARVFTAPEVAMQMISFQTFLVVASLISLVPSVMLAQQKNLENHLREREASLLESQRVARMGHYIFRPQTGQWTGSVTLDDISGITPDYPHTLEGWLGLVHPEDQAGLRQHLTEQVLRNRQPFDREYRIRRASDHAERWMHGQGQLETDAAGQPVSMFGTIQDITELRRAQADFRMLFEKMIDGFALHEMIFDAQGQPADYRFLMVNPAFERLTGLKAGQVLGRAAKEVLPKLEPFWIETYGRVAATGEPAFFNRFSQALGRHYEVSAFRPAPGQFACVMVDKTEWFAAQAALQRGEAELATIYNHTPLMLFLVNQECRIERMNRTMSDLAGQAEAGEGCPGPGDALKCIHALENPLGCGHGPACSACPLRLAVLDTFKTGRNARDIEVSLALKRQGKETEMHLRVATARVEIAGDTKVLVCMEDITSRRQLEQMLRQAQKLEGIGQLAGGVAHDFNNILTAILMQICNLQTEPGLQRHVVETLHELEQETRRAADLTRRLLLFSRRSVMQIRTLDLNEVLDNLLKMLRRLIGERITIQLRMHPAPVWIEADAGMIEQIIMNLAVNARDAMPKGGEMAVAVELCELPAGIPLENPEARSGWFARLTVRDTGTGIAPEHLERIFEPFFTTKEEGKGTGLGLATVYGITKQHNGWIELHSELGKGSTFQVFLPTAPAPPAAEATAVILPQQRGAGETILLVEDEPTVRRAIAMALRRQGYQVLEAANGADALDVWGRRQQEIALLFTDIIMPGQLDGLELAGRLREARPNLPVIISSGYNADTILPNAEAVRMMFLPKPSPAPTVARAVRECLKGSVGTPGGSAR